VVGGDGLERCFDARRGVGKKRGVAICLEAHRKKKKKKEMKKQQLLTQQEYIEEASQTLLRVSLLPPRAHQKHVCYTGSYHDTILHESVRDVDIPSHHASGAKGDQRRGVRVVDARHLGRGTARRN
jgi:hypothetical protein